MMTTDEKGHTPPDAENYLDLSGVPEETSGPHFDVVLRGYDRGQVDEHVAGLRRMVSQLRAQLAVRERRRGGSGRDGAAADAAAPAGTPPVAPSPRSPSTAPAAAGATSAAAPAEQGAAGPDMVGAFNDRLRGILQAAEQEAQAVRSRAAESLLAEHSESRAALADLRAQRDAVFDELMRTKGRLDELVAHSGRPVPPPPGPAPRAWGAPPPGWGRGGPPHQGPPQGPPPGSRPGDGYRRGDAPRAQGDGDVDADTAGDTGSSVISLQPVDPAGRGGTTSG